MSGPLFQPTADLCTTVTVWAGRPLEEQGDPFKMTRSKREAIPKKQTSLNRLATISPAED